jgi:ATP-dependent exoDNAse (exonuclease V) beta subunit
MSSAKWKDSKYYGKTAEEIKELWNQNGDAASSKGTAMHLAIEQFIHGHPEMIDAGVLDTKEWTYFSNFWRDVKDDLVPYRSEWEVWSEEYKLAGSIDMVFYRKSDQSYVIYDWKRSKEIKMENDYENGLGPLSHLPACNYWQYTIQLNLYRWILENHYGMPIKGMYLIVLHPDNKTYKRYPLNRLEEEIDDILAARRAGMERGLSVYGGD